jgi:hypothetical protein
MSFLTNADVVGLAEIGRSGFETIAAVNGEYWVVFSRWVGGVEITTAPQRVTKTYADRQERTITTDAGQTVTIDGYLIALEPFDVKKDDLFSLGGTGDEERGEILRVFDPVLGTQRAAFRLRLGEM